jgi:hypothetical protein
VDDAGVDFVIARVALAARANELELFVSSELGADGGAAIAWARRGVDGGWSGFTTHSVVTSAPLSLDVAAWSATRFDLTFQGACGAGANRLCQQFWQNDLFSPVYDLGVPADAGVLPNGPFLPSTLVAPAPDRLAAYGFYATPGGRRLARTAYTGVLPWQPFTSPATQPGFIGFFDGAGRTSAQGQETTVLVGRVDTPAVRLRAIVHAGPSSGGGSWQQPTDLPFLTNSQRDAIPALAKSLLSPTDWVVVYDMNSSGLLHRLQGDGNQSWGPWVTLEPAPTWKASVSPSCTNTPSREVCAVVRNGTNEVWIVEVQEMGGGALQRTFSLVGRP